MTKNQILSLSIWLAAGSYAAATMGALTASSGKWVWLWLINVIYAAIVLSVYKEWRD